MPRSNPNAPDERVPSVPQDRDEELEMADDDEDFEDDEDLDDESEVEEEDVTDE